MTTDPIRAANGIPLGAKLDLTHEELLDLWQRLCGSTEEILSPQMLAFAVVASTIAGNRARAALAAAPPEPEPVGELVRFPFTVEQLRDQWNAQADEFNQWESLGLDEQIGWAQARAAALIEQQAATIAALSAAPEVGEGEAIGSEWQPCVKLPITVHVREQRPGETHVSTREGVTPVRRDDLIMRGVQGEEYPIGRELFNRTYRLGAAAPAPTVAEGEVEEWTDKELYDLACEYDGEPVESMRAAIAVDRQRRAVPGEGEVRAAIDVIESVAGFEDETTSVGEAWAIVLRQLSATPQQPAPGEGEGLSVQAATALFMETYAAAPTAQCHPNSAMGKHQRQQAALAAVLAADRQRRAQPPQGEEVG